MLIAHDIIGDIHGHYHRLIALLEKLGYEPTGDSWKHPEGRKLVFAGDYIDRGPQIKEVLELVRGCVEAGDAYAIMGNHEFNAIAYETPAPERKTSEEDDVNTWCRPHSDRNNHQYEATRAQLNDDERKYWTDWFRTLPPVWEGDGVRVVHACSNYEAIGRIKEALHQNVGGDGGERRWTDALIKQATDKSTQLYKDHELVFKGLEITLPDGRILTDKAGIERTEARVQWWRESWPDEPFGDWLMPPSNEITDPVGMVPVDGITLCRKDDPITCVGHYWMPAKKGGKDVKPQPMHDKIVCVDYSVAKGGYMCAYRFNGEIEAKPDILCGSN